MQTKYGVNTFVDKVYIQPVDFEDVFKIPEFIYVVDIVTVHSHKGNGLQHMNIYTEGKLEEFIVGNWNISPIIELPFTWCGNSVHIQLSDSSKQIITKKGTPDPRSSYNKTDYFDDIKWVFDTIKSFEYIESKEHFDLTEQIIETIRLLNVYLKYDASIFDYYKIVSRVQSDVKRLDEIKLNLSDKCYQKTKTELKNAINLLRNIKIKNLTD